MSSDYGDTDIEDDSDDESPDISHPTKGDPLSRAQDTHCTMYIGGETASHGNDPAMDDTASVTESDNVRDIHNKKNERRRWRKKSEAKEGMFHLERVEAVDSFVSPVDAFLNFFDE